MRLQVLGKEVSRDRGRAVSERALGRGRRREGSGRATQSRIPAACAGPALLSRDAGRSLGRRGTNQKTSVPARTRAQSPSSMPAPPLPMAPGHPEHLFNQVLREAGSALLGKGSCTSFSLVLRATRK